MLRSRHAVVLLALLPFAASADALSYDYLEAGYVKSDTAGDATGWGVGGSMSIDPRFHVFGHYTKQNADQVGAVDIKQWELGAGFRHPINAKTDLVSHIAWESVDAAQIHEANGLAVEVGVHAALGEHVDTWAMGGYADLDHGDGEFFTRLGGEAKFSANWGIAGDVKFIHGDTQWFVGPRFHW